MHQTVTIPERRDSCLFRMFISTLVKCTIALPLFGFLYSVIWSALFYSKKTTWTHCEVTNWLPSISAAFNYPPMSFVWRICIALHSSPRFLFAIGAYSLNKQRKMRQTSRIFQLSRFQGQVAFLALLAHVIEVLCLVLLTNISSGENKPLHVISFSSFVAFSIINLVLMCAMHSAMTIESSAQARSLRMKRRLCFINVLSLLCAVYLYYRHNKYCEVGVYTGFAFCEYIFVLTNIGFHLYSTTHDLGEYILKIEQDAGTKLF